MNELSVTVRVDFGPACSVGPGKISLLEHIGRTGSLSEAARKLKMSYRRAWLLLEDINQSFPQAAARLSVGGRGGGGAALTEFGTELVAAYRSLETDVERRARSAFPAAALAGAGSARNRAPPMRRRVSRRLAPRPQSRRRS